MPYLTSPSRKKCIFTAEFYAAPFSDQTYNPVNNRYLP